MSPVSHSLAAVKISDTCRRGRHFSSGGTAGTPAAAMFSWSGRKGNRCFMKFPARAPRRFMKFPIRLARRALSCDILSFIGMGKEPLSPKGARTEAGQGGASELAAVAGVGARATEAATGPFQALGKPRLPSAMRSAPPSCPGGAQPRQAAQARRSAPSSGPGAHQIAERHSTKPAQPLAPSRSSANLGAGAWPARPVMTQTKRPRSFWPRGLLLLRCEGDYFAITILITSVVPPSAATLA